MFYFSYSSDSIATIVYYFKYQMILTNRAVGGWSEVYCFPVVPFKTKLLAQHKYVYKNTNPLIDSYWELNTLKFTETNCLKHNKSTLQ